jgi:threonine aldolase
VKQKLVYISNSTEVGTIYTKELEDYQILQRKNLYLFMDGARLGYALMAESNDVT